MIIYEEFHDLLKWWCLTCCSSATNSVCHSTADALCGSHSRQNTLGRDSVWSLLREVLTQACNNPLWFSVVTKLYTHLSAGTWHAKVTVRNAGKCVAHRTTCRRCWLVNRKGDQHNGIIEMTSKVCYYETCQGRTNCTHTHTYSKKHLM